jgi:hypothetical protein
MLATALQTLSPAALQMLNFAAIAGPIFIALALVFTWAMYHKKKRKRKRRHQGHGRLNPTRAQVGGLPPVRDGHSAGSGADSPFDP